MLSSFTFIEEVCECETCAGKRKTVESIQKYSRTSEVGILPKLIEERVIEPMVMTAVV